MKNWNASGQASALALALTLATSGAWAQQANPAPKTDTNAKDADVTVLSPFEVTADTDNGYAVDTTLAGNRLNTKLRDIGNAVTVVNTQFLKDIGATDNTTLLQYTTNTEVGSVYGNFQGSGDGATLDESPKFTNPNANTRVRGLAAADNTRDYFLTDIPWEGYNIDGVDLQRGPNSILFGQGSPAGIINTRTKQASYKDSNEVTFRVGSFGSNRTTLDVNKVLLKNELAIRFAAVRNDEKFKQEPSFSKSNRAYGAIRWEPSFLKKGGARTIIKANIEFGDVKSNNPRNIPPIDKITPWFLTGTTAGLDAANQPFNFSNLNRRTINPQQNVDNNTGLPFHGQTVTTHNGPTDIAFSANQYYIPWVGNFGNQFGNPIGNFNSNSSAPQGNYLLWEPKSNHAINSSGVVDPSIGALPFQRPAGIAGYAQFAQQAKLPFSDKGVYKDKTLTDASIFDFYNLLLDGPNKHEWQNFRTYNISLAQTFFNDKVGFEGVYNNEWYKNGQVGLLDGNGSQAIGVDISSAYPDGTNNGAGFAAYNGTPNPNVGRAYLSSASQYVNNSYLSNRNSRRFTVFARHNFDEGANGNWFTHFLGEHTITGLANKDIQTTDTRSWQRYGTDAAYEAFVNDLNPVNKIKFNSNPLTPTTVIYLGSSLAGRTTASGANLPNPTATFEVKSGSVRAFDSTWKWSLNPLDPGYVNPAAPYHDPYYPLVNPVSTDGLYRDSSGVVLAPGALPGDGTQNTNPANYVGWRNVPMNIINSDASAANRDLLTHDAKLTRSQLTSTAATWQGNFWGNALVATWGVRKDISRSWAYSANVNSTKRDETVSDPKERAANIEWNKQHPNPTDDYGHLNFNPNSYHLVNDPDTTLEVISHAWTAMVHLNELPGLKKLPIHVSVFYNHSTDFQPASQRVDAYGSPLAPPSGATKDTGILLETKDGKYSLKINKYTTSAVNASSGALSGAWFIGQSQERIGNWANRYEFNWYNSDTNSGVNSFTSADWQWQAFNFAPVGSESLADAAAREAAVIAATRAWQKSAPAQKMYKAWGVNLNDPTKAITSAIPNGFAVTEDSVSKGYEIEFTALPVKNWRLTFNASKTTAIRTNIGGTALTEFISSYEKALKTTPMGDLRIWWGSLVPKDTALGQWNDLEGAEWALRKLQEGTNVPELRKWRFNAITNYDFQEGFLKGFNVGAGVRYESDIVIGYKPKAGATAADVNFDLTNPYKGPSEKNFDFWIGYGRKLSKNIDWRVQLNVRNAFVGNELIPLTAEPNGDYATYRIRPPQTWQLTNTFTF